MKTLENSKYIGEWDGSERLYRITRKSDGLRGGFIEGLHNLSEYGDCWVYDNAIVRDNAIVCDNARISGSAIVCDNARVRGNAEVYDNAIVCDNAKVFNNAIVCDNAKVFDNAIVCDNAKVFDNAIVCDNARVFDNAIVCDNARVRGNAEVFDSATVIDSALVTQKIFNLDYDKYVITGTDNHLRIGCKQYTYEEWWNFTDEEIAEMDKGALEWWKKWKPILQAIFTCKGVK